MVVNVLFKITRPEKPSAKQCTRMGSDVDSTPSSPVRLISPFGTLAPIASAPPFRVSPCPHTHYPSRILAVQLQRQFNENIRREMTECAIFVIYRSPASTRRVGRGYG